MKIEIYGAEWCGYCKSAVSLCESRDMQYDYFDVDDTINLRALEERMGSKVRTIPQIFKDGEILPGGFSGLQQELAKG
ncbi:MAG TPA: glutaredoxin domain-containing protein [Ignavibacteriaceae bacterium]